jgi:hypothetical protein
VIPFVFCSAESITEAHEVHDMPLTRRTRSRALIELSMILSDGEGIMYLVHYVGDAAKNCFNEYQLPEWADVFKYLD